LPLKYSFPEQLQTCRCRCALSMQLNSSGSRGRLLIACSAPWVRLKSWLQLTLQLKHHHVHPPTAEVELGQKLAVGHYFFKGE